MSDVDATPSTLREWFAAANNGEVAEVDRCYAQLMVVDESKKRADAESDDDNDKSTPKDSRHAAFTVNARDGRGRTALCCAARHGNDHVVQWLIAHGARDDLEDQTHFTPAHHAVVGGFPSTLRLLLASKARVNDQQETCAHVAARISADRSLAADTIHNKKRAQGVIECLALLLEHNASPRDVNDDGMDALDVACAVGNLAAICEFVAHGWHLEAVQAPKTRSAIHYAAAAGTNPRSTNKTASIAVACSLACCPFSSEPARSCPRASVRVR
jgi:ankyrin repeat protein